MKTQKRELTFFQRDPLVVWYYMCGGDGVDGGDVICDYLIVGMPRCVIRDVMDDRCCGNVKWGEVNRDEDRVCESRFCRRVLKREKYNVVIGDGCGRDVSHIGSDNSLCRRNQFRICERRTLIVHRDHRVYVE